MVPPFADAAPAGSEDARSLGVDRPGGLRATGAAGHAAADGQDRRPNRCRRPPVPVASRGAAREAAKSARIVRRLRRGPASTPDASAGGVSCKVPKGRMAVTGRSMDLSRDVTGSGVPGVRRGPDRRSGTFRECAQVGDRPRRRAALVLLPAGDRVAVGHGIVGLLAALGVFRPAPARGRGDARNLRRQPGTLKHRPGPLAASLCRVRTLARDASDGHCAPRSGRRPDRAAGPDAAACVPGLRRNRKALAVASDPGLTRSAIGRSRKRLRHSVRDALFLHGPHGPARPIMCASRRRRPARRGPSPPQFRQAAGEVCDPDRFSCGGTGRVRLSAFRRGRRVRRAPPPCIVRLAAAHLAKASAVIVTMPRAGSAERVRSAPQRRQRSDETTPDLPWRMDFPRGTPVPEARRLGAGYLRGARRQKDCPRRRRQSRSGTHSPFHRRPDPAWIVARQPEAPPCSKRPPSTG